MPGSREKFLAEAVKLALDNVATLNGGPFGAVLVKDGEIIARAANGVTLLHDPTAHAEILVIRDACKKMQAFSLEDCELYSSCEPCPMCLTAIYWARIKAVYYAATKEDAAKAGFDDQTLYNEFLKPPAERIIPANRIILPGDQQPFDLWIRSKHKIHY